VTWTVAAAARPILQLVTDRRRHATLTGPASLDRIVETARRAAEGGIDLIQIREAGLADRDLLALVTRVLSAVRHTAARVLVNGRTDVALAAAAHGVHLPASAPVASRVRRIVAADFVIGRSVHSRAEAQAAEADGGCDYLTFGTVFATTSKPADHTIAGMPTLQEVCTAVRLPILAIGGLSRERMPEVAKAGAAGVAAIGLFADASAGDAQEMRTIVDGLRMAYATGVRG
jgi:thiamine-phosphate diphosphorylase